MFSKRFMFRWLIFILLVAAIAIPVYFFFEKPKTDVAAIAKAEIKKEETVSSSKKKKKGKTKFVNTLPIIDSLVIHKEERELLVFSKNDLVKTYHVSLGPFPVGDKEYEGDGKTPEGIYYINGKNPNSIYHKNLGVSYPNEEDIAQAKAIGKRTGGDIKIHGLPMGYEGPRQKYLAKDWTAGCIALTNQEIDELYERVKVGAPVVITP